MHDAYRRAHRSEELLMAESLQQSDSYYLCSHAYLLDVAGDLGVLRHKPQVLQDAKHPSPTNVGRWVNALQRVLVSHS